MKYIATAMTAAALSMSFNASAANPSDIAIQVSSNANQAKVQVTEAGHPLKNYPITVEGLHTEHLKTANDGSLTIYNHSSHSQTVKFIVDKDGQTVTKQRFMAHQS
ncbi:hypothetical protein ACFODT_11600 [Vibrio zhugei]|uniref:Uncharacterized protein n=1 Tax=Vibrio zhugei TaxID=2479546 RepID=A0ABV7CC79_9VIBR|nr:hypothetical protein [Vibrio zhugei]